MKVAALVINLFFEGFLATWVVRPENLVCFYKELVLNHLRNFLDGFEDIAWFCYVMF